MRRLSRLDRSTSLLRPRSIISSSCPFLCTTCARPSPFSTSTLLSAKEKLPYTEKLRRRIWGTDNPPGAADPYTGSHVDAVNAKRGAKSQLDEVGTEQKPVEIRVKHQDREIDDTYEPASTWEGLAVVGEIPEPEFFFQGFISGKKSVSAAEAAVAVRRAVIEVLVTKEAGLPLGGIGDDGVYPDLTQDVQITFGADGTPSLEFLHGGPTRGDVIYTLSATKSTIPADDETAVKTDPTESEEDVAADRSVVDPLHHDETPAGETDIENHPTESEEDVNADRSTIDPLEDTEKAEEEERQALVASWDPVWKSMSLENPELKFAVLKRVMQLTSIRLLDPNIHAINSIPALLGNLITRPKPRKLVQTLTEKEELVSLPNVKIIGRKVTDIDKEIAVGRWKVIEEELLKRGLPVYLNPKDPRNQHPKV